MDTISSMNVISQKYDNSLDFHVTMYDNLPYKRDADYCNIEKVTLHSANLIKYYLCVNKTDGVSISNKDDKIEEIMDKQRKLLASSTTVEPVVTQDSSENPEITAKQIQTLLTDPTKEDFAEPDMDTESMDDQDDNAAAPDSVNAFANVEDW